MLQIDLFLSPISKQKLKAEPIGVNFNQGPAYRKVKVLSIKQRVDQTDKFVPRCFKQAVRKQESQMDSESFHNTVSGATCRAKELALAEPHILLRS